MLVLITAGDQVPATPLLEVSGSAGAVEFRQISPITSKAGVILGVTTTSSVVMLAQIPASGVKV